MGGLSDKLCVSHATLWRTLITFGSLLPALVHSWSLTTSAATQRCPTEWTEAGDSCYRVFTFDQPPDGTSQTAAPSSGRGWKQARLSCMVLGSDLVSINTNREAHNVDAIRRNSGVDDTHYYWVGLHDAATEGNFRWVDGSNVTFSRWKVGEPTSSVPHNPRVLEENYVVAHGGADWMDVESTWRRYTSCLEPYAYICEKPLRAGASADVEMNKRVTRILGLAGSTGSKGDPGTNGDPGHPGTPGLPGQQGARGPAGQPGRHGQKGDRGDDGRVGATGPQGDQGPPGQIQVMDTLIGPDGAPGQPGPQGEAGPTGPSGRDGQKGDRGFTGPLGPVGPQGTKGQQGDTGRPGRQGPRGLIGPMGPTGAPGLTGRTGQRGATGLTGPKGSTGGKGDKGVVGATGTAGQTGATGARGLRGPMGVQGLTGGTGPKGDKGIKGNTGPQGDLGPKGTKGDTGEQGLPGFDGVPGIPGAIGPEGAQGRVGEPGRDGRNGIPGMPGTDGQPGPRGDRGGTGPRGHSGPPGPPGPVPANAAVVGPSTYGKGANNGWNRKTIFVNATAFCRGRPAAAFAHPLHCWQFITCGSLYGGDMEHTCYAGRRFDYQGPECKKDHTCVFGAPSATNEEWKENERLAALALKEGGTHFAQRTVVEKIRATHSVYSAGMVVIFVLMAALAAIVVRLQLTRRRDILPPLVIEKPGSVV